MLVKNILFSDPFSFSYYFSILIGVFILFIVVSIIQNVFPTYLPNSRVEHYREINTKKIDIRENHNKILYFKFPFLTNKQLLILNKQGVIGNVIKNKWYYLDFIYYKRISSIIIYPNSHNKFDINIEDISNKILIINGKYHNNNKILSILINNINTEKILIAKERIPFGFSLNNIYIETEKFSVKGMKTFMNKIKK